MIVVSGNRIRYVGLPGELTYWGLDVSKYQGIIDFTRVAAQADFCYIRASYAVASGVLTADQRWWYNWPDAEASGILRGAYHFYYPGALGVTQAKFFLATVGDDRGDMPLAIDVEAPARDWTVAEISNLRACLDTVESITGRIPVIYTGNWYWDPYLRNNLDTRWAERYPLWLGEYVDISQLGLPTPWRSVGYTVWQYTSSGNAAAYGCQGTGLDLDRFDGIRLEWDAFNGGIVANNRYKFLGPAGEPYGFMEVNGSIVPDTPPPTALDIWSEKYYAGAQWAGNPLYTTTSQGPALDHKWDGGSPNSAVPVDDFSAIFELDHNFEAGTYEVKVRSDDGFEYQVDGKAVVGLSGLIVQSAASKEYVGSFTVTAGVHHVRLIYTEFKGWAEIHASAPAKK